MRLEHRHHARLGVALARRTQCCSDLGRVVGVVVDDRDPVDLSDMFEPTTDTTERGQAREGAVEIDLERRRRRERHGRIAKVVQSRHAKLEIHSPPVGKTDRRRVAIRTPHGIRHADIRIRGRTDTPHRHCKLVAHASRAAVIRANQRAGCTTGEVHERRFELIDRAVTLEVIRFDVADDGDGGIQLQERAVILIGLDDIQGFVPEPYVTLPNCDPPADESRGIPPRAHERSGDHGRRRGLAVRAGDANDGAIGNDLGQRLSPGDDRNPGTPRSFQFGMIGRNGRGVDHGSGLLDMTGIVPFEDGGAGPDDIGRCG
jgi:hypothetical protein